MKDIKTALFENLLSAEKMEGWTRESMMDRGKSNDPTSPELNNWRVWSNAVSIMRNTLEQSGAVEEYEAWKAQQ